jgi:hypothetical protein
MKVKVGNKVYDCEEEPVMVILTDQDKKNIASMRSECTKYCMFPCDYVPEEVEIWMDEV